MRMESTTLSMDSIGLSALSLNTSSNGITEMAAISEEFRRKYLQELQAHTTPSVIPATVVYLLLAVVGVIGNSFVLYVYSSQFVLNGTRVFIVAIAAFDFITNVLVIPVDVYDMFHAWDFSNHLLCRTRRFISALTTIVSAFLLTALAVLRYRKVCVPFGWQISLRQAKLIVVIVTFVSALCSAPYAAISGKHTKETPHPQISGHECSTDDMFVDTIWPVVNSAFFILLYLATSVTTVVLYCQVGRKIWRHDRALGQGDRRAVGNADRKINGNIAGAAGSTSLWNWVRLSSGCACATRSNTETGKLNEKPTDALERDFASQTKVSFSAIGVSEEAEGDLVKTVQFKTTKSSKMDKMKANGQSEDDRGRLEENEEREGKSTKDFQSEEPQNAATIYRGAGLIGGNRISHDTAGSSYQDLQHADKTDRDTKLDPVLRKSVSAPTLKDLPHTDANFINSSKHNVNEACIKPQRNLRRTTAMLVTTSAVYIIGYLPCLGLLLYFDYSFEEYEALDGVPLALYELFLRSIFVNTASNAMIYGFYDLTFRAKCVSIIRRKLGCVMTQDSAISVTSADYHSTT